MPYFRPGLGFTPEQETELLSTQRAHGSQLQELVDGARAAERMRTITIIATVGGLLYSLARIGEFVADAREKRRAKTERKEGVSW